MGNILHPLQQFFQNNPPDPNVPQPNNAPDPLAQIQQIAGQRQLVQVQNQQRQNCVDYLYNRTQGKFIDDQYVAYCSALLNEYLDRHHIVAQDQRRQLTQGVIAEHVRERLAEPPVLNEDVIEAINNYNANQFGIIRKRNLLLPWQIYETQALRNRNHYLNFQQLQSNQPSIKWYHFVMPCATLILIGMGVKSFISHLSPNPINTFTTHNAQKLAQELIKIDMLQNSLNAMIQH